jgi:hypothetical protein
MINIMNRSQQLLLTLGTSTYGSEGATFTAC